MEQKPKISLPEIYLLVVFALIADLINWIPVVNWLVDLIELPGYWLYFRMKGVLTHGWLIGGGVVEAIPVLSVLPGTTASIVAIIIMDRVAAAAPKEIQKTLAKVPGEKTPPTSSGSGTPTPAPASNQGSTKAPSVASPASSGGTTG